MYFSADVQQPQQAEAPQRDLDLGTWSQGPASGPYSVQHIFWKKIFTDKLQSSYLGHSLLNYLGNLWGRAGQTLWFRLRRGESEGGGLAGAPVQVPAGEDSESVLDSLTASGT